VDATTVAAFIVPVKTSRAVCGLAVPTPTFPAGLMNSAVDPVVVLKLATFPAPSCWTDRALPELVLPKTRQFAVEIT
jgi:hypothetical protein